MSMHSCVHFKWGGRGEPRSKGAPCVVLVVSVPECEAEGVRACGHPQGGDLGGLLSLFYLCLTADLSQKYWPWLLLTTSSAGLWQGRGRTGVSQITHFVIHLLVWETGNLSSLGNKKKQRYKTSKHLRRWCLVLFAGPTPIQWSRIQPLAGLQGSFYTATCTGKALG